MSGRGNRLACAALVAVAIAGCGDARSGDAPPRAAHAATTRTTAAIPHSMGDARLAQVALLRRADVPTDVTGEDPSFNKASCSPRVLFKHLATGMATTARYIYANGRVQQTVALFHNDRAAARAYQLLTSASSHRCTERYVHQTVAEEAQGPVGPVHEQVLKITAQGQATTAYRLIVPVYDVHVTALVDILLNRIGRSISSVSAIWTAEPPTLVFEEDLTARIAARLRQALAA